MRWVVPDRAVVVIWFELVATVIETGEAVAPVWVRLPTLSTTVSVPGRVEAAKSGA